MGMEVYSRWDSLMSLKYEFMVTRNLNCGLNILGQGKMKDEIKMYNSRTGWIGLAVWVAGLDMLDGLCGDYQDWCFDADASTFR